MAAHRARRNTVTNTDLETTPGVRRNRVYRRVSKQQAPTGGGSPYMVAITAWAGIIGVSLSLIGAAYIYYGADGREKRGRDEGYRAATLVENATQPTVGETLRLGEEQVRGMLADAPANKLNPDEITKMEIKGWQTSHGAVTAADAIMSFCYQPSVDGGQVYNSFLSTANNTVAEPAWTVNAVTPMGVPCNG